MRNTTVLYTGGEVGLDCLYRQHALDPAADGKGFEGEPLLVGVVYKWEQPIVETVQGEVILREAPMDPVADLPVAKLISLNYYQRQGGYEARILESVSASDIAPYVHQRYDDFAALAG